MSPSTAPASGAQRAIGRLRNRSKTPLEMSWLSISPVPKVANTTVMHQQPRQLVLQVRVRAAVAMAPPNT